MQKTSQPTTKRKKPLRISDHKININANGRGHGIIYIKNTTSAEIYFDFLADVRLLTDKNVWHGTYAQVKQVHSLDIHNKVSGYDFDDMCPVIINVIKKDGEKWLNRNFEQVFDDSGKTKFATRLIV